MKQLWLIASNTVLELIRDKFLYGLLLLATLLISLAYYVSDLSYGYRQRIIIDISLAVINLFGVITAVFLGCTALDKEKSKKTLLLLLSKPIARSKILLGKYLGYCLIIAIKISVMTVTLLIVLWALDASLPKLLGLSISMIYLEIMLVLALALFFSTLFSSTTISIFVTTIIYWLGHYNDLLRQPSSFITEGSFNFLYMISLALPNFQSFNFTKQMINHLPITEYLVYCNLAYGILYIALLLMGANLIFNKKLIF